jgi:hypothetical protein
LDKETCIAIYSLPDWKDLPFGSYSISGRGICMGYDEDGNFTKLKGECDLCETDDNICNAYDSEEVCEGASGTWTSYDIRENCEERGICSDGSVTHNNGLCFEEIVSASNCAQYNDDKDACDEYCTGKWVQAQCENRPEPSGSSIYEVHASDSQLGECSNPTYDDQYCECLLADDIWSPKTDDDNDELEWIPENSWVSFHAADICEQYGYTWQIENNDPSLDNYTHNPTCYDDLYADESDKYKEGYCKVDGVEFDGYCPESVGEGLQKDCCWSEGAGQSWVSCNDYPTCTGLV